MFQVQIWLTGGIAQRKTTKCIIWCIKGNSRTCACIYHMMWMNTLYSFVWFTFKILHVSWVQCIFIYYMILTLCTLALSTFIFACFHLNTYFYLIRPLVTYTHTHYNSYKMHLLRLTLVFFFITIILFLSV